MKKKLLSLALALALAAGLCVPALAAGSSETIPLSMVTVTLNNVLRKETVTYSFEEIDYDLDTEELVSLGMTTKDYTIYIVSDGSFSYRISANPGQDIGRTIVVDCCLHFYDKKKECFNSADGGGDVFFDASKVPTSSSALTNHLSWAQTAYPGRPIMYQLGAYLLDNSDETDYVYVMEESAFAATKPTKSTQPSTPAAKTAYASTQAIEVDGQKVTFEAYALKDANGNDTNYIKLRDVASVLNGTAAQFQVGWNGSVTITTGQAYTPNGSEMHTPYSGDRAYQEASAATVVNGSPVELSAILLTDDAGSGYTYYKLRDLGTALGFTVDWSVERGIFIETN